MIKQFASLLGDNAESLAKTLTSEMGKPLGQARGEIKGTIGRIEYFLAETEKRLGPQTVLKDEKPGGTSEIIAFEPLGVVANVSAWNYPYFQEQLIGDLSVGLPRSHQPGHQVLPRGQAVAVVARALGRADPAGRQLGLAPYLERLLLSAPNRSAATRSIAIAARRSSAPHELPTRELEQALGERRLQRLGGLTAAINAARRPLGACAPGRSARAAAISGSA